MRRHPLETHLFVNYVFLKPADLVLFAVIRRYLTDKTDKGAKKDNHGDKNSQTNTLNF